MRTSFKGKSPFNHPHRYFPVRLAEALLPFLGGRDEARGKKGMLPFDSDIPVKDNLYKGSHTVIRMGS
jgi:hypothetical protein